MCGFYGVIDFNGNISEQDKIDVSNGADLAKYRGPDDSRLFSNQYFCVKFNRLSIIDLSAECQPFISENENIILVCNGEIYNFNDLRSQLLAKKYIFKTNNDIEALLHGYAEWGASLFEKIEGMFSLVIWDKLKKHAVLARDHVGIKPLHYKIQNNKMIFSTDHNSFKKSSLFKREIDDESMLSYFSFRYVIGEKTFYKNIFDVLPGNYITYNGEKLEKYQYWDIELGNNQEKHSEKWYQENLEALLGDAVGSHLMSDVPLGAFISGGLDSSLILYFMSKIKSNIRTFSTGFQDEKYNELKYINLINDELKTELTYIEMTESDFIGNIERTLNFRGEPVSIPHETAFLKMSEIMKKDISVVLSGEGADEFFGGYGRLFRSPHDHYKKNIFQINKTSPIDHFIKNYAWFSNEDKNQILNLDYFNNKYYDNYSMQYLHSVFNKYKNKSYYEQMYYIMPKIHLPNMLNRLDRMTMAASVEARVPFLDKKLIEFASNIPIEYKLRWRTKFSKLRSILLNSSEISEIHDIPKYLLKKIAVGKFSSEIINRKKIAFPLPMNKWLDSSMKNIAQSMLLDSNAKISKIINQKYLSNFLNKSYFSSNEDLDGKRIWMLINLELWLQNNS